MKMRIAVIALTAGVMLGSSAARAADTYVIDPVHSFASFSVGHLGKIGLVRGFFSDISGTITFDAKDAAKDAIEVAIKTASVNTHADKRDEDLRSANFFDVGKYPVMTFKSTRIARKGDHYTVTGDFTLLGVTKKIAVTAKHLGEGKDPWGGYRAGFTADFSIMRSQFGMKYELPETPDKVDISVAFEGIRK
jgi:polyisoprenoid-binding protein YceI